jgi:hypothetical protein
LDRLAAALPEDVVSRLYFGRVEELDLERRIASSVGSAELLGLARQRYRFPDAQCLSAADALAETWSRLEPTSSADLVASDDAADPRSLYASMCRVMGELRLPFRVAISEALSAAAATGESVVAVATGRMLGAARTRRIVIHEIYGHVLPRVRAAALPLGLFGVGSSLGNDVQEGWALSQEIAHDVMDDERRRELGLRHLAAHGVARGADWIETTRLLLDRGAQVPEAIELSARAHRGGGLARERIYLPAWCHVRDALDEQPELAHWLGRGRISVHAARVLKDARGSWDV